MNKKETETSNNNDTTIELSDDDLDQVEGGVHGSASPNSGIKSERKGIAGSATPNSGFDAEKNKG